MTDASKMSVFSLPAVSSRSSLMQPDGSSEASRHIRLSQCASDTSTGPSATLYDTRNKQLSLQKCRDRESGCNAEPSRIQNAADSSKGRPMRDKIRHDAFLFTAHAGLHMQSETFRPLRTGCFISAGMRCHTVFRENVGNE